jgi:hypothetical protein
MEAYFNDYSWIVYPENEKSELKMLITFSNNSDNNVMIDYLINQYNGKLSRCTIGNHTQLITIQNVEVLNLLSFIFKNDSGKKYIHFELFKEFITIYKNQMKYLKNTFMI